jgi:hypothetical protein
VIALSLPSWQAGSKIERGKEGNMMKTHMTIRGAQSVMGWMTKRLEFESW